MGLYSEEEKEKIIKILSVLKGMSYQEANNFIYELREVIKEKAKL